MPGKHVHFAVLSLPDSDSRPEPEPPTAVVIHPELSHPTYLDCDISSTTFDITIRGSATNQRLLGDPATSPPLSSLTINCRYLPWRIDVGNSAREYVTVEDVLRGIHQSLRTNITPAEWSNLAPPRESAITTSYERRWRRIADPTTQSVERSKGVKRVDFLGPKCGFNGLSCTHKDGSFPEFTLHLRTITTDPPRRGLLEVLGLRPLPTQYAVGVVEDESHSYEQGSDSQLAEPTFLNESAPGQPSIQRNVRETDPFQAQTPRSHIPPRRDLGGHGSPMNDHDQGRETFPAHGAEPTLVSSMFEQAHDFTISGGQFYSAPGGNITVDSSQDASTHRTSVTNLWQYNHGSHHIAIAATAPSHIGGVPNQPTTLGAENQPSSITTNSLGDGSSSQASEEGPVTHPACSPHEDETSTRLEGIYHLEQQLDDSGKQPSLSDLDDVQEESSQNLVIVQNSSVMITHPAEHSMLIDDIIFDTLSHYPPSPLGLDVRAVHRIISALLFSFSPLSIGALATLLKFDNVQQVRAILLSVSPLIVVPDSNMDTDTELVGHGDDELGIHTRAPVRFMDPSIAEFFLDRMRSGQYYADAFVGHRALLDACTWVMARVDLRHRSENTFEASMQWRWREAYDYACRNWERHLLVRNKCRRRIRSKL